MMHALVIAAEVAEEEGSHVAFYVLGLLLAGWAVAVSVVGIRRAADFPPRVGARNGVVALSALLVVGACATAVITA